MRGRNRSWWIIALIVLAGLFIGNLIGEALQNTLPILGRYAPVGFSPQEINLLGVARFTLGVSLRVNLMGALGAIVALIGCQRM